MDKNNVKLIKYIKAAILIILIITVLISAKETFNEIMKSYYSENTDINYWVYPVAIIESIIAGAIQNIGFVIIYLAAVLASRSAYRTKLDETDFEKNKKFYRDTVKNYSVSVLNYIDKFKLDYSQSYTAKLLELEKNKIIKIEGNKIKIIGEPKEEIDKCFVSSIKDNKVTMPLAEYERLIVDEALEKGLITKASFFGTLKDKKMRVIMLIVFVIMFAFAFLIASLQEGDLTAKLFIASILGFFVIGYIVFFLFTYFAIYTWKVSNERRYMRTEKGKEINLQLDGLKLFMEKFSNIKSREAEHLVLWEDYLIYSVMFDINKKIQTEYSKFF